MGHHGKKFVDNPMLDPVVAKRAFTVAAVIGAVGLAASFGGWAIGDKEQKAQFFFSWLTAFYTFTSISLGALFFIIIHHLTRASWSTTFRRSAENMAMNLPYMAILIIPVILGMDTLFHSWMQPDAADKFIANKAGYLNQTAFLIRMAVYFGAWTLMIRFFRKHSVAQDADGESSHNFRMRWWAPISMSVFAFSVTFSAFDWLMSLNPHWFSTMFGIYIFAGGVVAFFATLTLTGLWLTRPGRFENTITVGNLHDSNKLMWGFIVFWTYVAFSQYFLIWYANIPEETQWFQARLHHGWENVARLTVVGHFMVPFWLMMSRHMKRNRMVMGLAAGWMLLMHAVDIYFVVMPENSSLHGHFHFHWLNVTCLVGVGGVWAALFLRHYMKDAAVSHRDPQLAASMEYDNV